MISMLFHFNPALATNHYQDNEKLMSKNIIANHIWEI